MNQIKIGIIDYQAGNLGSVKNAFDFLQTHHLKLKNIHIDVSLESQPEKLSSYDKLLLPGVGAFGKAMERLNECHLAEAIREFAKSGKAMLGICLGMQLLFDKSEEFGICDGLGLISGEVVGFQKNKNLKIPHIGWNSCAFSAKGKENQLLQDVQDNSFFYFVHSFFVRTKPQHILAYTHYGEEFASIIALNNLYGIQAHPEKSHNIGLELLANFVKI